jgi:hypothetical protein
MAKLTKTATLDLGKKTARIDPDVDRLVDLARTVGHKGTNLPFDLFHPASPITIAARAAGQAAAAVQTLHTLGDFVEAFAAEARDRVSKSYRNAVRDVERFGQRVRSSVSLTRAMELLAVEVEARAPRGSVVHPGYASLTIAVAVGHSVTGISHRGHTVEARFELDIFRTVEHLDPSNPERKLSTLAGSLVATVRSTSSALSPALATAVARVGLDLAALCGEVVEVFDSADIVAHSSFDFEREAAEHADKQHRR